jgi:hypothetical protein
MCYTTRMTHTDEGKINLTNAVDKREWLAARGLAKAGTRGKFSNAAKEALAEAEKNGTLFIDKKTIVTTVRTRVDGEIVEEKREFNPWAQHARPIREGMLDFVGKGRVKVKVNATEACHNCHYSFGWCHCDMPSFLYWKTGEVLRYAAYV